MTDICEQLGTSLSLLHMEAALEVKYFNSKSKIALSSALETVSSQMEPHSCTTGCMCTSECAWEWVMVVLSVTKPITSLHFEFSPNS